MGSCMKDDAYELLAQRYAELEQEKAELAELLDRAETERDALAAHLERGNIIWSQWENRGPEGMAYKHLTNSLAEWFKYEPDTSLARRDAEVIRSLRFPTMLRKVWSGGDVQRWLDEQAEEKLHQAKKGES